jgi:hypothetical protein
MRCTKILSIVATFLFAGFFLLPAAKADNWNELTKLTFSEPIQLPNRVLPAGTYWFRLMNLQSN